MRPLAEMLLGWLRRALVRGAALLVPAGMRAEWVREWQAEIWHVERSGAGGWAATAFCLGAVQDAWCLWQQARGDKGLPASLHGSAGQSLLAMATVLAASCLIAYLLPEARSAINPLPVSARTGLILIQKAAGEKGDGMSIPFEQFLAWSRSRQHYFDEMAFYRMSRETVLDGDSLKGGWKVAYATSNLFTLLGVPVRLEDDGAVADDGMPAVIISDAMWRRAFGFDPDVVGRILRVGRREARIAGVVAGRSWKLPGHADAWVLEPQAAMTAHAGGNVVAHLTSAGRAQMWAGSVRITASEPDNRELDLVGFSIGEEAASPWQLYQFALFLALLSLPAITTVSLGEYGSSPHRPQWPRRIVRWLYFGAKIVLLLPIVYYLSIDLAYWRLFGSAYAADYIQMVSAFTLCLGGMRWVLLDQRQRCPVCLRRVAHPAQVGLASRTFLAWNGTELVCAGGHTLLHVPGLPTSWFGTQRWLYLDASWDFLFAAGPDAG
jgi:MacB-like periplasmic core domain